MHEDEADVVFTAGGAGGEAEAPGGGFEITVMGGQGGVEGGVQAGVVEAAVQAVGAQQEVAATGKLDGLDFGFAHVAGADHVGEVVRGVAVGHGLAGVGVGLILSEGLDALGRQAVEAGVAHAHDVAAAVATQPGRGQGGGAGGEGDFAQGGLDVFVGGVHVGGNGGRAQVVGGVQGSAVFDQGCGGDIAAGPAAHTVGKGDKERLAGFVGKLHGAMGEPVFVDEVAGAIDLRPGELPAFEVLAAAGAWGGERVLGHGVVCLAFAE